jgi:thermostable 8-oxoguanine DNA glycosylase
MARDLIDRPPSATPKVKTEEMLKAGQTLQRGFDIESIRTIYRWKLQSFLRFPWVKAFPDKVSDELKDAIEAARKATYSDKQSVRDALKKLDAIPWVGIPVASAFLTAIHPDQFTVIDRKVYRSLGVKFRASIPEYLDYLTFCHEQAVRLGISLREHDKALWRYGTKPSRSRCSDERGKPSD